MGIQHHPVIEQVQILIARDPGLLWHPRLVQIPVQKQQIYRGRTLLCFIWINKNYDIPKSRCRHMEERDPLLELHYRGHLWYSNCYLDDEHHYYLISCTRINRR